MSLSSRVGRAGTVALALAALAGCSGQPSRPGDASPAATALPAAATAPSSATASAPASTTVSTTTSAPASTSIDAAASAAPAADVERTAEPAAPPSDRKKVPGGYRLVKRNGKELYCRAETVIGTRFAEQMCFTREQIQEISDRTDHAMDDFEQARKTCTGGPHCVNY
jgi:hypothetical protein